MQKLKNTIQIAAFAPAFSFKKEKFFLALKTLKKKYNIEVLYLDSIFEHDGYFAGTKKRRIEEILYWLENPKIKTLIAARGGYGCSDIYLDLKKEIKKLKIKTKKTIIGYSDLTVFLNALKTDFNFKTFHGPVLTSQNLLNLTELEEKTFLSAIKNQYTKKIKILNTENLNLKNLEICCTGKATAPIVGGCLSLVTSALSTPYEINLDNKILFFEDVLERPYRIDRMLTQLIHSKKLDKVKGIIVGQMKDCTPPPIEFFGYQTPTVEETIKRILIPFCQKKEIPLVLNFPAGHGDIQITFPIGVNVNLNVQKNNFELKFLN